MPAGKLLGILLLGLTIGCVKDLHRHDVCRPSLFLQW